MTDEGDPARTADLCAIRISAPASPWTDANMVTALAAGLAIVKPRAACELKTALVCRPVYHCLQALTPSGRCVWGGASNCCVRIRALLVFQGVACRLLPPRRGST